MFLFLFSSLMAQPTCSTPLSNDNFVQVLDSIELEFVKGDLPKIKTKIDALEQSIPCLTQRLLPEFSARYHLLKGVTSWIADHELEAKRSFSVAKRSDPNATISTHIFPKNHIIHELYEQVEPVGYTQVTTVPSLGSYVFDGYLIPRRPQNAPTIIQIIDKEKIYGSKYLVTDAQLIQYKKKKTHHKSIALGASALSLIVGIGFQWDAQMSRLSYEERKEKISLTNHLQISYELEDEYNDHTRQYHRSLAAFGIASGLFGASFLLEW